MTTTKILGARAIQPVDIVGQRIVAIGPLTEQEQKEAGFTTPALYIGLENGITLVPISDTEANNAGWLDIATHDNYGPITFD